MTEVEQQPQTNGIETIGEEDDGSKVRPADIEAVCINAMHIVCHSRQWFSIIVRSLLGYAGDGST